MDRSKLIGRHEKLRSCPIIATRCLPGVQLHLSKRHVSENIQSKTAETTTQSECTEKYHVFIVCNEREK